MPAFREEHCLKLVSAFTAARGSCGYVSGGVSALLEEPGIDGREFVLFLVASNFRIQQPVIVQVVVHVCETCLETL